jgi:hypothetical protein
MTFLTVDQKKQFDSQKTILKKARYLQSLYFNFIHFEDEAPQKVTKNSLTLDIDDDSVVMYREGDMSPDRSGIFSYMREKQCHCLYCGDRLLTKGNESSLYRSAATHSCDARKSIEVVNDEWREDVAELDFVSTKVHSLLARLRKVELTDRDAEFVRAFIMDVYQQSKVTFGAESIETIDNMIQSSLDALIMLRSPKNTQLAKVLSYCEDILDTCGVIYASFSEEEMNMTRREFEEYLDQSKREVEEVDMKNEKERSFRLIKGGQYEGLKAGKDSTQHQRSLVKSDTQTKENVQETVMFRGVDDDSFEVVATYYGQ